MSDSAQLFTGVHDTPAYTRLFNRSTRIWVAAPVVLGGVSTPVLAAVNLDSGHARAILIAGILITAALTALGALVPRSRPNMAFRAKAHRASIRPRLHSSTDTALLAPPTDIIDNLWFAANGNVYACYLMAGLPYHLRSLRKRSAVADLHAILARELPADSYLFGLHVPQDQRQLLRAMVHDHRDQAAWVNSCMQMAPEMARQNPATRVYWLAVPVDSGRAGHNPVGQATKVKDWISGRDKDSDSSLQAYQNLAYDIASSIPPQFSPLPATADMLDWFWRHNAWLATFNEPLPRRRQQTRESQRISGAALPQAQFDEGDQLHKPQRPALLQWLPSWKKLVRVHSPEQLYPDSYQAILPVVDSPEGGIVFPGSEFLSSLDDLTGATFDFLINLTARPRELEFRRNDLAKGNVDDQFDQRGDIRNGYTELRSTARKIDEYNRLLSANIDEQPLGAAFLIHVGAPDARSLDYAIKRVKEELTQSGQIVIRHYRGAQTRLWSAFNIGTAQHNSGIDQFSSPHDGDQVVPVRAPDLSATGQHDRNPAGIQQEQRQQQCRHARPSRHRTSQPQPSALADRRTRIRQVLRGQAHRPRRNTARRTSLHRRPRRLPGMGHRPGRRPQQSHHRHGRQQLRLLPTTHLPRTTSPAPTGSTT